nr:hypothetical protein Iba_scaffold61382CG0020 [Ipomoea batatas]
MVVSQLRSHKPSILLSSWDPPLGTSFEPNLAAVLPSSYFLCPKSQFGLLSCISLQSGATPEFPDFCSVSLQSRTFLIKLQVLSISLSKEVNFIREKSSLQAGIGARVVPCPAGFPSTEELFSVTTSSPIPET